MTDRLTATEVDQDTVLALLEDGPKSAEQLAEWLQVSRIQAARALRTMERDGLVKVTGVEKRWALASYVPPIGRPVSVSPTPARPAPRPTFNPALRQVDSIPKPVERVAATEGVSFWVGKSRDELRQAIAEHEPRMKASREARQVSSLTGLRGTL